MAQTPPQLAQSPAADSCTGMSGWWQAGRLVQVAVAFAIGLAVLGQGINTPFIKDAEPQSAQWIVDIVDNGNWLLPRDYYHIVNPKPPLFYWLSAIVAKVSGGHVDEVRARAVSLAAGAALAAEVMAWTAVRLGPYGGWLAFVFLLGTYGFAARATVALTDMLLTFLLFSLYIILMPQITSFAYSVESTESGPGNASDKDDKGEAYASSASRWRTVTAGFLLGLAILTKGPLAAVLLAFAAFIYLLLLRANPLRAFMCAWPWTVLALGLAFACIWYVPAFIAGRTANLGEIVFHENLGHFLPASAGGTGEAARPAYYIGLRLIGGSFPLSLLIPAVVVSCRDFAMNVRRDLLYQLAMVLAVVLLFSIASAKRDDYILPALPSLAILFAAQFVCLDGTANSCGRVAAKLRDVAVAGSGAVMLAGTFAILFFIRNGGTLSILGSHFASSDESYAAIFAHGIARLTPPFMVFLILVIVGASAAIAGVGYARPRVSGAGFGLLCVAASVLWIGTVKPMEASTRSVAGFAAKVRAEVGDRPIYVARPYPELAWYYGRGIPVLPRAIAASGPSPGIKVYFVGRPGDLAMIAPSIRARMQLMIRSQVLGAGGPPALYRLQSLK
jgi:4-amino-4-deoxy-L-arabinose transferase-like glycosyltransferase